MGLWLGVDLTDAHYVVKYQPEASMDQWCDVSGTFNCSEVARSKYSAIPIGDGPAMPVSVPAVGFFAALGLLALLAGLAGDEERRRKGLAASAVAGRIVRRPGRCAIERARGMPAGHASRRNVGRPHATAQAKQQV